MKQRTLPSNGNKMRLLRIVEKKYCFSSKDVARWLERCDETGRWYIKQLLNEGAIVFSHKVAGLNFYKVKR